MLFKYFQPTLILVVVILCSFEVTESFESINQCTGVNIFATDDSIYYYVRSVKYLQHTVLVENLSGLRTGTGLGISWNKYPYEDSNYALQIRFKHYLVLCCMALNPNITNVREYDVKLLDKSGGYIVQPTHSVDPTKFPADGNLFVDMSKNPMGSYGVEITIKRTQSMNSGVVNEPPLNIEITMFLCEKTANVSEKMRQQQAAHIRLRDVQLFEACMSDDQCDRLIVGEARCLNGTCQCAYGKEINKFNCPIVASGSIEDLSLASDNINLNALNRSKNRTMRFVELGRIDCLQDKDCQTTFLDLNMECVNFKCQCMLGYRLAQDPVDLKIKCFKSSGGSILKFPQSCEMPTCDFILYLFVFDLPSNSQSLPTQRLVSVTLITDHNYYIREFYQIVFSEDKIKVFLDQDDTLRVILDDRFYKLYRKLVLQDGYKIRTNRDTSESEPILIRKPRYILQKLADSSPNITKESPNEVIVQYDTEEYKYLSYYINSWSMNAGNMTLYNFDFNANFSNLILKEMFTNATIPIQTTSTTTTTSTTSTPNSQFPSPVTTTKEEQLDYEEETTTTQFTLETPSESRSTQPQEQSESPSPPTYESISCLMLKLVRGNYVQMTPSPSAPTKQPFFFETKHTTRLVGFLFCLNTNINSPTVNRTTNSSQCKNGVLLQESKFPITSTQLSQMKYTCHCWTGYWGTQCESVNPCYTMIQNSTRIPNSTEPLPVQTKFCQNEGQCLATRSTALYYYLSGIKYLAYCLCRPQFSGKTCERNLDGCTYPFIYKDKFYNKCLINQSNGLPFCARNVTNLDENPMNMTKCSYIPCKIPWWFQNTVNYNRCIYRQYRDEKGIYESPMCSLTRNYELFRAWRFCERDDFL